MKNIKSCMKALGLLLLFAASGTARAEEIVSDGARGCLNLAGAWDVLPIDGLAFNFPPPAGGWKQENVPGISATLKEGSPYGENLAEYLTKDKSALRQPTGNAAWFRRSFLVPGQLAPGQQVRLYFGGIAFKSEVWLNGKKLGGSMLGQVPCNYDVTGLVRSGANELVVGLAGRTGLVDVPNQTLLAPHWGVGAGIWGKVELQLLPQTAIGKVFINTRVKEKRIELNVQVTNHGKRSETVALNVVITDSRQDVQTQIAGPTVTLAPGETKTVELKKDWIAPSLWSPANAALYFAKIALLSNTTTIDSRTLRFGFREFEIRGTDFYLNGVKTILLRNSHLRSLTATRAECFAEVRSTAGQPYNCIRLHGGFNSEALLDLCDEMGVMAIPEGAWHQADVSKFNLDKSEVWLPTVERYFTETIEQFYNHPSVIMWSLTNETYWGNTTPERMKIAERLIAVAKAADSTRPIQGDAEVTWGGRLPVINIHYPEGSVVNSLRAQYPNSGFVFPNDFYWLKKNGESGSWRATFVWDRPLVIGEYWYPSGGVDPDSAFMGESVYDWEKWRIQRMDGVDDEVCPDNEFVKSQQGLTDAYRIQGVAGVNPWASNGQKVMPALAVRPVDFFPNFFGGASGSRKFVVFNETGKSYADMNLQCRLESDGKTLWETTFPAPVGPGEVKTFDVKMELPAVTHQVSAKLTVRLRTQRGGGMYQLGRFEDTVFILPRPNLADVSPANIRLLDSDGTTAAALATLGLKLNPLPGITSADLKGIKTLIVGEKTDPSACKDVLVQFAAKGGSVIVLRQDDWTPLTGELPAIDKEHVSTRAWRRTFNHPITDGLEDAQFSYWRPDHLVSLKTFRKPAGGNFRALLDCGGLYGLSWTPLVDVPVGRGTFVLTSLDLIGRLAVEPAAGQLLAGMIRYAERFEPAATAPLRLLAGTGAKSLRAALKAAGVVAEEGLTGIGPILLDASLDPTPAQLAEISKFLTNGGSVWLHGFSTQTLGKVAALFPFKPELKPYDPSVQSAIRRSEDPWINNLSSQDFFWTKVDLEARTDYFGAAQATAHLGGDVLQLPTLQSGTRLIEPALLVKVPAGKGAILFDSLAWEKALGSETEKVTRLVSSLAANLGAETCSTADKIQYDYFGINLKPWANMGYYDRVANDGKGGWMDDGENDMRFFLINHVGKAGGIERGMEIQAEPFPAVATFAARPFALTDPRKTADRAIISLRGGEHGAKLPNEAKGIKVGKKADKLWFLQSAGGLPKEAGQVVANYIFHYADGTSVTFPIRSGIEVGSFWDPAPISGAAVAWTGRNLVHSPIGIYSAEWTNPFPDKIIESIDVVGNLASSQFVVMAISRGIIKSTGPRAEVVSDWQFGSFAAGSVPNSIPAGGSLTAGTSAPVPDAGGLKFGDGRSLGGEIKAIAGLADFGSHPFAVRIVFTPSDKPAGFCGGLLEAGSYGKNGFRMTLGRDMRLGVEVYSADGIKYLPSRTVFETGRTYTVELRLDGTYVTFLVDGQTDTMKELSMPAPYNGSFRIGVASGKDYFFNGTISSITVLKLPAAQ